MVSTQGKCAFMAMLPTLLGTVAASLSLLGLLTNAQADAIASTTIPDSSGGASDTMYNNDGTSHTFSIGGSVRYTKEGDYSIGSFARAILPGQNQTSTFNTVGPALETISVSSGAKDGSILATEYWAYIAPSPPHNVYTRTTVCTLTYYASPSDASTSHSISGAGTFGKFLSYYGYGGAQYKVSSSSSGKLSSGSPPRPVISTAGSHVTDYPLSADNGD